MTSVKTGSAEGITIVSASAGSGKTYRLTEEVTAALDPKAKDRVALEGLVAVTFTTKAHAELGARIRRKLVEEGAYEEAMRLPLAYLGTVHGACLRLLQEFALDAGLSPNVDVVAESQSRLLRQALEAALSPEARRHLDALAARVELRYAPMTKRFDWLTPVADVMELARSNRISPSALPAMAERSATGLLALLPAPPARDAAALDAALEREMSRALALLAKKGDETKATSEAIRLIEDAEKRHRDGELRWSDWAKLAAVTPAKASADCVKGLNEAALEYERHPRLRSELHALTLAIFDAARVGLDAYQEWKARRRVVDYVDMLDRALDLVEHPRVRAELARRLELVVVDEFQDTSPIQLALFVRMHALAGRSVWVGDRKQCIFEYAGADPRLMDDVAAWVASSGGARDRLEKNWRSRSELVGLCNALFSAALARHGFSQDEVTVAPVRGARSDLPPVGVWWLETTKNADDAHAIAEGVRRTLAAPEETPVTDRATNETRPVRPGDIAILVTTNQAAREVAGALHARGIRAAIARAGLLATPEGTLIDAALRWMLDDRDNLAAANLDALTGFGGASPDAWLEGLLRAADRPEDGWRAALGEVREELSVLSPAEALDRALDALDATHLAARWPDAAQRLANLDALRALAAGYEARAAQAREAATVAGLLRTFDDLREERLVRDEMLASDDQHVPADDGAVVVCTYHRAKGLEWPVVVLANLDKAERRGAFDVAPESEGQAFDPARPLEGRWIRYWPWPFGATKKVPLTEAASQSAIGKEVALREDKERARLLYVGFTRARDHLVLAVRAGKKGPKAQWLDALSDDQGAPLVTLGDRVRVGKEHEVPARVLSLGADPPSRPRSRDGERPPEPRWFVRPADAAPSRAPYWITPSSAEGADVALGVVEKLPTAILVDHGGYAYDALGNAVHAFLAADTDGLAPDERLARAERLLVAANLAAHVRAESLVRAGDELRAWVERRFRDAVWHREIPVDAFVGEQRVRGIIDLLLETAEGCVVIDHKTFPGTTEAAWRAKCAEFAPQLDAYADVLVRAGKPVLACWVHLPVGGGMVEVVRTRA